MRVLYALSGLTVLLGSLTIGNLLESQLDTKTYMKMQLLEASIAIPLCLLLIWQWSVVGLILGIVLSDLSMHLYGLLIIRKRYDLNIEYSYSLKVLLVSFSSALFMFLLFHLIFGWVTLTT